MIRYNRNNCAVARPLSFSKIDFSPIHIKNIREDFMDMFAAEHNLRKNNGDISCVFVLTYNNEHLTKKYGRNLLNSDDLKVFSKSSRFYKNLVRNLGYTFDFVCVGEYGSDGKGHSKKSTRGYGNNPHYHCVGWFHKLPIRSKSNVKAYLSSLGISSSDPSVFLPLLVRYEWQKSLHNDILMYSKSYSDDSKGFVELDGEVRSSAGGSTYISKYIGKDIKKLFLDTYFKGFVPSVVRALEETISLELSGFGVAPDVALDINSIHSLIRYFCYNCDCRCLSLLRNSGSFISDFPKDIPSEIVGNFQLFKTLVLKMSERYEELYSDFYSDLNGKHSPKVRKFHSFGYSLFNSANIEDGTYTIFKKSGYITRSLPPSLIRHFYYNHYTLDSPFKSKIICYEPNDLGKKLILSKCDTKCKSDLDLIRSLGSPLLKCFAQEVVNFTNYLSHYSFHKECFNGANIGKLLHNTPWCQDVLLSCKVFDTDYLYTYSHNFGQVFDDFHRLLKEKCPSIYGGYLELLSLRENQLAHSVESARDFNAHWENCYMSNY